MGRIRKTQLEKDGHSWDMNERSTKVGEVCHSYQHRWPAAAVTNQLRFR